MFQGAKRPRDEMPWFALIVTVLISLSFPLSGRAARPQQRIRELLDAVSAVLDDPRLQSPDKEVERQQRVQRIIHDTFAFEEMTTEALGTSWARLTPQQREEFTRCWASSSSARTTASC
jgi:ABC-type transporter MlaC component